MPITVLNVPLPLGDPISKRKDTKKYGQGQDPNEGQVTRVWTDYFTSLQTTVDATVQRVNSVSLDSQGASIAATDMSGGTLSAGLYTLSYYARITRAATTNSSLTVTLDWQDEGTAPTYSGAAMAGNTTTTVQSGTLLIDVDGSSPVRYSTTYASTGATSMQYKLRIVLQKVQA